MTWEYRVFQPTLQWNRDLDAQLEAQLCRLGSEGWELVCATGTERNTFVLKRPKVRSKAARAPVEASSS